MIFLVELASRNHIRHGWTLDPFLAIGSHRKTIFSVAMLAVIIRALLSIPHTYVFQYDTQRSRASGRRWLGVLFYLWLIDRYY